MKFSRLFTILLIGAAAALFTACPNNLAPEKLPWAVEVRDLEVTAFNTGVLLTWTNPDYPGFEGVEISYTDGFMSEPVVISDIEGTNNWRISSGLTNDTEYTFTVKGVDGSGNKTAGVSKTASPSAEVAAADVPYPVEVLKLTAVMGDAANIHTDGSADYRQLVYLSWQYPQDGNLQKKVRITALAGQDYIEGWGGNNAKVAPDPSDVPTNTPVVAIIPVYVDSSNPTFPTAGEYEITVQLYDAAGNLSEGVTVKVASSIGEVQSLTAETTGSGEITLKCQAPFNGSGDIGAFDLRGDGVYITASPAAPGFPKTIPVDHEDYTALTGGGLAVTGLSNGTAYTFTVKTYDTVTSGATYYTAGVSASAAPAAAITGVELAIGSAASPPVYGAPETLPSELSPADLKTAIGSAAITVGQTIKLSGLPLDNAAFLFALYEAINGKGVNVKLDLSDCTGSVFTGVPAEPGIADHPWTAAAQGKARITAVTLPDSVTELVTVGQYGAFYGFTALSTLDARGLERIGDYSFYGCTALAGASANRDIGITLGAEPPVLGNHVFQACGENKTIALRVKNAGMVYRSWYNANKDKFRPTGVGNAFSVAIYVYDAIDIPVADIVEGARIDLTAVNNGDRAQYGYEITAENEEEKSLATLGPSKFYQYWTTPDSGYTLNHATQPNPYTSNRDDYANPFKDCALTATLRGDVWRVQALDAVVHDYDPSAKTPSASARSRSVQLSYKR